MSRIPPLRLAGLSAALLLGGFSLPPVRAAEPAPPTQAQAKEDSPKVSLLDAMRDGSVAVAAEGNGEGGMTVTVTNRTQRPLRVVLPPGLIATGATGQMGGMGGGMGGMGGGMGGMGGGMGGMGGGMGGMGGGMGGGMSGGMGGGMGGGMSGGGGTMPATMGMMMLGQLIMSLAGERDSWDSSSLMMGMMGGMGGGMMGGGMGGRGMMGGMGGGMRSVPPTELPFATLKAGQTKNLPTRLVQLSRVDPEHPVVMPEKGEKLQISDIAQKNADVRVQKALRRLAADKAPVTIAQLVMWNVAGKLDWETIAGLAKKTANAHELSLAREFVAKLDTLPDGETGALLCEIRGADEAQSVLAAELAGRLEGQSVLGLPVKSSVPSRPDAPGVACKVQIKGTAKAPEAQVQVAISDGPATAWVPVGKFTLPVERSQDGKVDGEKFADSLVEGVLGRLVTAQLSKGPMVKGKQTYKVRIDNASPLLLNGVAVQGTLGAANDPLKVLAGISIPPRKNLTVSATGEMVEQLGLKKGIRIIAADLSGL